MCKIRNLAGMFIRKQFFNFSLDLYFKPRYALIMIFAVHVKDIKLGGFAAASQFSFWYYYYLLQTAIPAPSN
jgi:hypothetical protein